MQKKKNNVMLKIELSSSNGQKSSSISLPSSSSSLRSKILMAILIRWFRFQTYISVCLTAFMWMLICYFVFYLKNNQFDETNSFNLVSDIPEEQESKMVRELTLNLFFKSQQYLLTQQYNYQPINEVKGANLTRIFFIFGQHLMMNFQSSIVSCLWHTSL